MNCFYRKIGRHSAGCQFTECQNSAVCARRENGILLSLRAVPNGAFAKKNELSYLKRFLFTLAGTKYDAKAGRQFKAYRFLFVRSDGAQLETITRMVEAKRITPQLDPHAFDLSQINDALRLVAAGSTNGKVVVRVSL